MTAIKVLALDGPILIVNVYMPVDYGTAECVEAYNDACSNIVSLYQESEAVCLRPNSIRSNLIKTCLKPGFRQVRRLIRRLVGEAQIPLDRTSRRPGRGPGREPKKVRGLVRCYCYYYYYYYYYYY